jgi:hypothetical protein
VSKKCARADAGKERLERNVILEEGEKPVKKAFALVLAAVLVIALLNGCNNKTGSEAENTSTAAIEQTPAQSEPTQTPEPQESSPYNLAAGKYETGSDGWATELYNYELPLSTTDETFSYFILNFTPQYIPDGDMGNVPYVQKKAEMTGVNIEYILTTMENIDTTFSVMQASDDLPDIVSMATTGSVCPWRKPSTRNGTAISTTTKNTCPTISIR